MADMSRRDLRIWVKEELMYGAMTQALKQMREDGSVEADVLFKAELARLQKHLNLSDSTATWLQERVIKNDKD